MCNRKTINGALLLMICLFTASVGASTLMWKKSYGLEKQGKYAQAAEAIEPMAKAGKDEYAVLRYAYLLYKQGRYNDSFDYYRKAMEMNRDSLDARLGITLPLLAQKRWRQVAVYTRQVLVKAEWNHTAHVRLMTAEEGMRKWHTLGRHAQEVTRVYPSDPMLWVYLARARAWMGDVKSAKAAYEKVLIREPDNEEAAEYLAKNE